MDRINRIQLLLARLILFSLARTPLPAARALSQFYAGLLDKAVPRLRRVARENLLLAGYPEPEPIVAGVFRSIGRLLLVFSRFPQLNSGNIGQWIRYEGLEHFHAAKQQGRGILFVTAHLGNWELSAFAHGMLTEPMHVVIRPLDDRRIDNIVEGYRQLSGNTLIQKKDAARSILRALHANEAVGILIDQNTSRAEGTFVPFFGTLACAGTAFAKLAAHSGAAVIPGFAIWSDEEQRYVLKFLPALPLTGDVQTDTARLHAVLESVIRQHPDQWLWIHRRWKTRPQSIAPKN